MHNAKHIALGAVVQQMLSVAIIFLITRLLGIRTYGEVVTLTAIASTAYNFSSQWAQPYIARTVSVNFARSHKIDRAFLAPALISLIALLIAAFLLTHYFAGSIGDMSSIPMAMIYGSALGYFVFQMAKICFQVQHRFRLYGILLSLDKVLLLGSIVGLLLFGSLNSATVLWSYVASMLLAGLLGLFRALYGRLEWGNQGFVFGEYLRSVVPVSISVPILYLSSITFLILLARPDGGPELVAWIGIGNMVLGVLLQPINWLAPTLAPRLSIDVLAANAHDRINAYLKTWVMPFSMVMLWATVCITLALLFSPLLPLVLGAGFQGSEQIVALVALLSTAEVGNLMLVQILYARQLEKFLLACVSLKALPLMLGLASGVSIEHMLVLLNLGGWLAIAVSIYALRDMVDPRWIMRYSIPCACALSASIFITLPSGKWYLCILLVVLTPSTISLMRNLANHYKESRSARLKQ